MPVTLPACPPSPLPNCPIHDRVLTFFPHPFDCNCFFKCSHGRAFSKRCPYPLHWNTRLNVCDWPIGARCVVDQNPTTTTPGPPVNSCCPCRLVTNNLCVSTWTVTEQYCRAEAMGVILGVGYSTIF